MLLSLKGQRTSILLSKLIVIILSVFVYYAIVLLNLGIGSLLLNTLLPDGLTGKHLVQGALLQSQFINFVLPLTMTDFIYKLLFVILMFGLISVFVLSDRSKRIFGIILYSVWQWYLRASCPRQRTGRQTGRPKWPSRRMAES